MYRSPLDMAAVCGLTSLKDFQWRGKTEEWSNQYWFTGSVPSTTAEWRALYDALVVIEKALFSPGTRCIGGYGYDSNADDAHAVWVLDLLQPPNTPVVGTNAVSTNMPAPGDTAAWVRWKTSRTNSKGKAIYLRKYYHGIYLKGYATPDEILSSQVAELNNIGTKLMDGSFVDGRKLRSREHDEVLLGKGISPFVTTRTLKRRGKRPT